MKKKTLAVLLAPGLIWLSNYSTTMCGIQVDGENHFKIAPRPGGHFTQAGLSYDSVYGTVESRWKRQNCLHNHHSRQLRGGGQAPLRRCKHRGGGNLYL